MNNEPVAWLHIQGNHFEASDRQLFDDEIERGWEQKPLYTHPHSDKSVKAKTLKDREADRKRFSDEGFNRWLDEGITDSGHTVYDLVENVCEAWHGWENSQYYRPAKELNAGGEPVKNATYWKRQYNEMSALNDRLKSSLYHANEQIKYLELHPAKTPTDEEIIEEIADMYGQMITTSVETGDLIWFARAILRKAQEK